VILISVFVISGTGSLLSLGLDLSELPLCALFALAFSIATLYCILRQHAEMCVSRALGRCV
jgi:hypothetical protein